MAIEKLDKIPAEFAKISGVQALSVRPNQPSTYGVGGLDAKSLKAFFDKFPQEVADKYNAICDILSDPNKSLSHIAWGGEKSLADFFLTITTGELAKAIKALDPTTEEADSVQNILNNIHSIVSLLQAYLGNPEEDRKLENEYVQKDANGDVTVKGDITVNNGEISAPRIVASSSANLKTVTTDKLTVEKAANGNLGNAEIEGNLEVGGTVTVGGESVVTKRSDGYASIPALATDTINNNNGIHSMSDIAAEGKVSGETIKAYGSITGKSIESEGNVKAASGSITGNLDVDGNLDVKGNLNVQGTTVTHSHETLAVQDNLIITNSSGASFSSSGLAILTPSGSCYGILYLPEGESGEAVYIGQGRVKPDGEFEFGNYVNGTFYPNPNEAVPLAARSGDFGNKAIPMWDASKNAFVSSGFNAYTLRGISEWTYEITEPSQFTTESLAMLHGNILVSCDIFTEDGNSVSVTIPTAVKVLNFNGHRTDYSLVGHSDCRLIGANIDVDISYENKVTNFGSVEFCGGSGQYVRCKRIAHSSLWNATNCTFITDCTPAYFESHYATFNGCSNITNVRVTDLEEDYGIEFIDCDHISNVSIDTGGDGVILYTNCTYVDALTCSGYGIGVPYIDADGIVSFLTSAEGGSYGS